MRVETVVVAGVRPHGVARSVVVVVHGAVDCRAPTRNDLLELRRRDLGPSSVVEGQRTESCARLDRNEGRRELRADRQILRTRARGVEVPNGGIDRQNHPAVARRFQGHLHRFREGRIGKRHLREHTGFARGGGQVDDRSDVLAVRIDDMPRRPVSPTAPFAPASPLPPFGPWSPISLGFTGASFARHCSRIVSTPFFVRHNCAELAPVATASVSARVATKACRTIRGEP
jgi:hypothetical protein